MFLSISSGASPLLGQFIWTFGMLAVLFALAWLFLRFGAPKLQTMRGPRRMKMLEKLPLEPGRSLMLVEVDGKTTLLAVTPGQITRLPLPGENRATDE